MTVTVRAPLDQITVAPPGLAVTVYAVISDPPLDAGAVHVTTAWLLPANAETLVGAPGVVAGVTALDATETGLVASAFMAVTVNV